MLLSFPALLLCGWCARVLPRDAQAKVDAVLGAIGWEFGLIFALAAVLALALFVASVVRKNPQVQFPAEFVVAATAIVLTPVY